MKIYMVSLAYAPSRIVIECMRQVYETIGIPVEHHVLMNHYPINQELNDKVLLAVFDHYKCKVHDLGANTGLSGGYNYLIQQLNLQDDDIVLGLDLDCYPITQNYGQALVKVLRGDKSIGWASLQNQHSVRELSERGFTPHVVDSILVHEAHTACVNSICAWSGKFLNGFGGLQEPNKWYGGLEAMSFGKVKQLGFKWVYLPQYEERFHPTMQADRCYIVYKWSLAHLKTTTLSFAEWLKEDLTRESME